jgi:hypothetical protein
LTLELAGGCGDELDLGIEVNRGDGDRRGAAAGLDGQSAAVGLGVEDGPSQHEIFLTFAGNRLLAAGPIVGVQDGQLHRVVVLRQRHCVDDEGALAQVLDRERRVRLVGAGRWGLKTRGVWSDREFCGAHFGEIV